MSSEPFFRRRCGRAAKKKSRPPKRLSSVQRARLTHAPETLEDRSLLSANYLAINPSGAANPTGLAALGGQALFAADDGTHGVELWKSDGTLSGTVMVKDINPGSTIDGSLSTPNSSNPSDLVTVGNYVYFAATDGTDGVQLWRSDGTYAGTTMITRLNTSGGGISPNDLTAANGKLYFVANDGTDGNQVWVSDGTAGGTTMISDLTPSGASANPSQLTAAGNLVYFTANTGSGGVQLYSADGIAADTRLVLNVTNGSLGASPTDLTNVNGTLYYAGYDSVHGNQLWKSNGTTSGTGMVAAIGSGTSSSNPTGLTNVGGTLFFAANDGTHGTQLWKSDGTSSGTQMVADINTTSAGASANPADLTNVNGTLYFRADDGQHGTQLWKSDGTTTGTSMVAIINNGGVGATPDNITATNGYAFFTANDGTHGFELWQTDGTSLGTTLVADINPGSPSSSPTYLTVAGNNILMAANDGTHGVSLYAATVPAAKPIAVDSSYSFTAGQALNVTAPGVLAGAVSAPGTTLAATLVSGPSHGTLTLHSDGSFTYTPNVGFDGKDTFTINASDGTNTSVKPATVTLESLDFRWVTNLYTAMLGRPVGTTSDTEVMYWVDQIQAGMSRAQVAGDFIHTNEYYTRLVNSYFNLALQRNADAGALGYFVGELEGGLSGTVVLSQIVSSSEFLSISGGTNGYVSNLYSVLFGRLPSATEFSFWVAQMNGGESPFQAALVFTSSSEYQAFLILSLYEQYLNRPVDSGGLAYWLSALQNGATPQTITTALVLSDEFYNG
ncbi:MAG TPA: ELWxxDGT repeat protein [Pirellulales bacterium]|nr:ELWxxDGT repeat protein [Pirellulales bacterium]